MRNDDNFPPRRGGLVGRLLAEPPRTVKSNGLPAGFEGVHFVSSFSVSEEPDTPEPYQPTHPIGQQWVAQSEAADKLLNRYMGEYLARKHKNFDEKRFTPLDRAGFATQRQMATARAFLARQRQDLERELPNIKSDRYRDKLLNKHRQQRDEFRSLGLLDDDDLDEEEMQLQHLAEKYIPIMTTPPILPPSPPPTPPGRDVVIPQDPITELLNIIKQHLGDEPLGQDIALAGEADTTMLANSINPMLDDNAASDSDHIRNALYQPDELSESARLQEAGLPAAVATAFARWVMQQAARPKPKPTPAPTPKDPANNNQPPANNNQSPPAHNPPPPKQEPPPPNNQPSPGNDAARAAAAAAGKTMTDPDNSSSAAQPNTHRLEDLARELNLPVGEIRNQDGRLSDLAAAYALEKAKARPDQDTGIARVINDDGSQNIIIALPTIAHKGSKETIDLTQMAIDKTVDHINANAGGSCYASQEFGGRDQKEERVPTPEGTKFYRKPDGTIKVVQLKDENGKPIPLNDFCKKILNTDDETLKYPNKLHLQTQSTNSKGVDSDITKYEKTAAEDLYTATGRPVLGVKKNIDKQNLEKEIEKIIKEYFNSPPKKK